MKSLLTMLALCLFGIAGAQQAPCTCSYLVKPPTYPKKAKEAGVSGKVIIEVSRDSLCLLSKPLIKEGLGYGCDEEALKIISASINRWNDCTRRCPPKQPCPAGKLLQTVTFRLHDE